MSKIKVNNNKNFTVIQNDILQNKQISLKAKGLFCYMWSLPDDWDYSINGLYSLCKDGRDSIRSAIKELEDNGYLVREKKRVGGKFSGNNYQLNEKPTTEKPLTEKPLTVKPTTEKPLTENPRQQSTKELSIKKESIKELNNKRQSVNYQQIADMYNEICISFPRLSVLSDSRKKAIKARLQTFNINDFKNMFDIAENSKFLKGANDRNWSATFDWMIKDTNMSKILEGNYNEKRQKEEPSKPKFDLPAWATTEI